MMKTFFLMTFLTLLLVFVGGLIGGESGMVAAFLFAAAMNFGTFWLSDRIVLAMYRARRLQSSENPGLFQTVEELGSRAELPMPALYVIENEHPNAFATGRDPSHSAVAVTTGLLRLLTREEIRGVIAHELSHIKHRDTLIAAVAATLAGAISMAATLAQWTMIFGGGRSSDDDDGGNWLVSIAAIVVAPIAALLIQLAISRSREFSADEGAARLTGDPTGLVRALRALQTKAQQIPMEASTATAHLFIVNPLGGGGLARLFTTHPPMEERIARLEALAYGPNVG